MSDTLHEVTVSEWTLKSETTETAQMKLAVVLTEVALHHTFPVSSMRLLVEIHVRVHAEISIELLMKHAKMTIS